MVINHKIDYKSYCKCSLLYEAVAGYTKDLNEVTKSLKSLILFPHAAGKQQKDIASHVGCGKASISHAINAVAFEGPGSMWETEEEHPTR